MRRRTAGLIVGSLSLVVSVATCSLKTNRPYAVVQVSAPATDAYGSRAIQNRQCFAVFVTGEGSDVTSTEFGTRTPSCFGTSGKYMGAFSYADLTNGNAKLTLAYGTHKVTLLAVDKSADCSGKDLSYYFPNSDTGVAVTYPVGNSGDVEINSGTTTITVTPTLYAETTDLATVCPREAPSCNTSDFCDTFTDVNGTAISAHIPDRGGSIWAVNGFPTGPAIQNGLGILSAAGGSGATFINDSISRDLAITARVSIGSYGLSYSDLSLLGRYTNTNNMVEANVRRNAGLCGMTLSEWLGGSYNVRAQSGIISCDPSATYTMQLSMQGTQLTFNFNGTSIQYSSAAPVLTGTSLGFKTEASGGPLVQVTVDSIIAQRTAR